MMPALPGTCRQKTVNINPEIEDKRSFAISQHRK